MSQFSKLYSAMYDLDIKNYTTENDIQKNDKLTYCALILNYWLAGGNCRRMSNLQNFNKNDIGELIRLTVEQLEQDEHFLQICVELIKNQESKLLEAIAIQMDMIDKDVWINLNPFDIMEMNLLSLPLKLRMHVPILNEKDMLQVENYQVSFNTPFQAIIVLEYLKHGSGDGE